MMNKTEFKKATISTSKEGFGQRILNLAYEKTGKSRFVREYVENKFGTPDKELEKSYGKEYDADVEIIESAAESYKYAMVGNGEFMGTETIQNGFFVRLYADEVTLTSDGCDIVREVLVVVPIIPKF